MMKKELWSIEYKDGFDASCLFSIKGCRIIAPFGSLESSELNNAPFCFRNSLKVRKEKHQPLSF